MAYSKNTWVDDTSPYLEAANLNNIEDGIEDVHDALDGGTTGQVLTKASASTLDTQWVTTPFTPYVAVSKWVGSGGTGSYEARPTVQSSGYVVFDASQDPLAPPPSSSSITGGGSPVVRDHWLTERTD